jgi:hypothetical protein
MSSSDSLGCCRTRVRPTLDESVSARGRPELHRPWAATFTAPSYYVGSFLATDAALLGLYTKRPFMMLTCPGAEQK